MFANLKIMLKLIFTGLLLFVCGCSQSGGTSTGNPLINIRVSSYSALSVMTVNQVVFCFKRLRFKQPGESTDSDSSIDSDNIDFFIGEKTLNTSGDNLGAVNVPPGQYERIEFDLEDDCTSGKSVRVTNNAGTFSTSDRITIKFSGTINISTDRDIDLNIQNLINALDTVTADNQIKTKLEAAGGSY